jgi:hypothetical protein
MNAQQKRKYVLLLLILTITAVFICTLFSQQQVPPPGKQTGITSPAAIEKQVAKNERAYTEKIEDLAAQNQALSQQLSQTAITLQAVQEKVKDKERQLQRLINNPPAQKMIRVVKEQTPTRTWQEYIPDRDTVAVQQEDSLRNQVQDYIWMNQTRDSLMRKQVVNLETVVLNRDSVIALQTRQYNELRLAFTGSLQTQSALQADMAWYKKQYQRQKVKSKLLSFSGLVLTAVFTHYLIRHKQ